MQKGGLRMTIEFSASGYKKAELRLYGELVGVSADDFARRLERLGEIDELLIRINSPGGDLFSGVAIYNLLRRYPAKKIVYIDGIAASAASIVAMAGDVVIMPPSSIFMIHNPQVDGLGGDADNLRRAADSLDEVKKSMVAAYVERTGLAESAIEKMVSAETWMTATRAVELGFADEIDKKIAVEITANGGSVMLNGVKIDSERFKRMLAELDEDDKAEVEELIEELVEKTADDAIKEGEPVELAEDDVEVLEELIGELVEKKVEEVLEEEDELTEEEVSIVARERKRVLALLALEKKVPGSGSIIRAAIRSGKQPTEVSMSLLLDDSVRRNATLASRRSGAVRYVPAGGASPNRRDRAVSSMIAHLKKIKGVR